MALTFDETITSRERLRELGGGEAFDLVINKSIDHIDDMCARFIAATPFVMVSTRGADGLLDMSPKGDPAGFVEVLDPKTLAIPDRLGNKRFDTFENLFENPEVGLFFMIPGNKDTLRVSGTGKLVRDSALQARMAVNGKEPNFVLIVTVQEAMMHCPKCMVRSHLWEPEKWPDLSQVPTLAEAMVVHAALSETTQDMQDLIDMDGEKRLY